MEEPTPILLCLFSPIACLVLVTQKYIFQSRRKYILENEQMYILHRYAGSAHLHAWSVTNVFLKARPDIFTSIFTSGHFAFFKSSAKRWGLDVQKRAEANRCASYMRPVPDKTPESVSACSQKCIFTLIQISFRCIPDIFTHLVYPFYGKMWV